MCTHSVNPERGLSTLIGPHPLCLESASGDTEHVIAGTARGVSRSTRVAPSLQSNTLRSTGGRTRPPVQRIEFRGREALGGGKRRSAAGGQARAIVTNDEIGRASCRERGEIEDVDGCG